MQRDRADKVGDLARLLWDDYNAGCAIQYNTPVKWVGHFEKRHPKVSEKVTTLMGDAYLDFLTELRENKDLF